MISGVRHIIPLLVFAFAIFAATNSAAQGSPYYTITYKDSLQKEPSSQFLYNNITVRNTYNKLISITISIQAPKNWNLISDEQTTVDLPPGETQIIPVTIARQPGALATWTPVSITAQLKNSPLLDRYEFFVKDKVITAFGIYPALQNLAVTNYQKDYEVKLLIRNRGNIDQRYKVILQNSAFELNDQHTVTVPARTDSNVAYTFHISKEMWNRLKSEEVRVRVINDSNKESNYSYTVEKVSSTAYQNSQAFATFPITLEGGLMQFNNTLAYYGGVTGDIAFNKESNLAFYYRSREFGLNGLQYNVFDLYYNYKNWQIAVGQMTGSKDFYTFGNGVRLSYIEKDGMSVSVYGIKHQKGFGISNDIYGANIAYHLNKIIIKHSFAASYDTSRNMNSYLLTTDAQLIKNKTTSLNVNAGTGFDHSSISRPGIKDTLGSSFGYNFLFNKNMLRIVSSIQRNSDNYPGAFRGYQYQNHDVRLQGKSSFIGLFYRYNYTRTNYFKDSIYNLTSYNYNLSNYGVQGGWSNKVINVVLGTGILSQTGQTTSPPRYQSFNLDLNLRVGRYLNFLSSSLLGYSSAPFSKSPDLYTQMISLSSTYGGVQMLYSKFPNYNVVYPSTPGPLAGDQSGIVETVNYGAYVNGKFFHSKLSARLAYFISQTLTDNTYISNANTSIRYDNKHEGLTVSLDGNMPLQKENMPNHYASLIILKDLNVPLVFKRKYFDLKITLYNDENSNGRFDANETPLSNLQVNINNMGMLTNEKGIMNYKNLEKGIYTLDFHTIKGLKGLIPANGFTQTVTVNGNTNISIPFKKSRMINGHLVAVLDSASHTEVTVGNYRVTATDSSGEKFTDLTEKNGDFTLSLPAGMYTVSLNPAAFNDETVKPSQLSYKVDLINNEEGIVTFKLIQKKRGVVFIKAEL